MAESQANQPINFSSFSDWCKHKDSLSESARHTVEVLLIETGTSNSNEAEKVLLNLTILSLNSNQITDITPLSALTSLTELYIYNNQITNFTPLSALTNLTKLSINNNQIIDITLLSALTNLTKLDLYNTQITDITGLSALTNLTELSLYGNQITDIASLSALTNLSELFLNGNQIIDITSLSALTNLTKLSLNHNQIIDITSLSTLTNLTYLDLFNNQITDITSLSRLTNLTDLDIRENQITDITSLSRLTNLTDLDIRENQITDITSLSGLTNLTDLNISKNQITDIAGLSALTNLRGLSLYDNPITDLNLSIELTQKYLTLSTTPIDSRTATETAKKLYTAIGLEAPQVIVYSSPQVFYLKLLEQFKIYSSSQHQKPSGIEATLTWENFLFPELFQSVDVGLSPALRRALWHEIILLESDAEHEIILELDAESENFLFPELFQSVDVGLSPALRRALWHEIILESDAELVLLSEFEDSVDNYLFSLGYMLLQPNYFQRPLNPKNLVKEIHLTEFAIAKFGVTLDEKAQELFRCKKELFEECGWIFPFEKVCIICDRPLHIRFDSENRLHAEGESAIAFADGWCLYFHHGVKLPEKYGKVHPDLWQAQWILDEENAEIRRLLIERIGYDRICQQLQAVELDSWQEYTLLKIDNADVEPIYLLKMTCPSTGHIHALRVPPALESAKDAISWVNWDIEPEQFSVQT